MRDAGLRGCVGRIINHLMVFDQGVVLECDQTLFKFAFHISSVS